MNAILSPTAGTVPASVRIADFAAAFSADHLAPSHFRQAARAFVDTFAVAVAGRRESAAAIALDYARQYTSSRTATVWGTGIRVPAEYAALCNGVAGHVLDYDDVTPVMRGHPSVALLPALVALAQTHGKSGKELAASFVAGFEVLCKLVRAFEFEHSAKGWHSTESVGMLAATVACCHLLGLARDQTAHALGVAVAQAAGTRANFGTMSKSFQAGQCGAGAVRATLLAQRGFTSSPAALDGKYGYMTLYADGEDLHGHLDSLGSAPLEIDSSGLEIKKYPQCYATHHATEAVLELRSEHGLTLGQVERAEIVTSPRAMVSLIHPRPRTGLEAKFSMQHAVAAALLDGHIKLASFDEAAVLRAQLQQFFPKVEAREEEAGPALPRWARVRVTTTDGRVLEKSVTRLRGAPEWPLSDAELIEKVEDCFTFGKYEASACAFADAALAMESIQVSEIPGLGASR